jgi:hypothetical protein
VRSEGAPLDASNMPSSSCRVTRVAGSLLARSSASRSANAGAAGRSGVRRRAAVSGATRWAAMPWAAPVFGEGAGGSLARDFEQDAELGAGAGQGGAIAGGGLFDVRLRASAMAASGANLSCSMVRGTGAATAGRGTTCKAMLPATGDRRGVGAAFCLT